MSTESKAFGRGDPVKFDGVPGFVVLLDGELSEVVPRQACTFSWELITGGATFKVTSTNQFDIRGKSISFMAVGAVRGEDLSTEKPMFVSIVAGRPVEGSVTMHVGI